MKKRICSFALAVAMCFSLSGCQIGNTEYELDVTHVDKHSVFTINEKECSVEQAKLYLCNYKNLYGTAYGVDLWGYDFGEVSLQEYVKAVTLSELTRVICMDLLAMDREIELTEEEKALCAKAADDYYASLSDVEKNYIGMSKSELATCYEDYALAGKLYMVLTEGINEEVSDDEARVIHILRILVTDKEDADAVAEKLSNGEDFASVATSFNQAESIDTYLARGEMVKEVEDVAFEMEDNSTSEMITTADGYYFIKCISKYEETMTEQNKVKILLRREKEQFNDVYDNYLDAANKGINRDTWDAITLDDSIEIKTDSFFATYDKYFDNRIIE